MASNIVSTTIDATFPVAGVDNDTQGFRDNFSIIKDNFAAAKAEIDSLQSDTAKLNENNNFDGNNIISAVLQGSGDAVSPQVTIVGNMELPWTEASYYAFTVNGNVTLTMTDWPVQPASPKTHILGKMTVQVTASTTSRIITFATVNGTLKLPSGVTNPVTLANGATNIYEFWTINGGTTVYGKLVGSYT
jgi:hypothetical protein